MRILLPPSETKKAGGSGAPLDLPGLSLSVLTAPREQVIDALVAVSADPERAQRVLKLSDRQRGEISNNRMLREAPTMPAVDRYTGVLYDALDAAGMGPQARAWLGRHVWIHSAPFGPVGALDAIPTYRLAAGTSLPGIAPLRAHWAAATSEAIAAEAPAFVLDLRSQAYVALGPVPASVPSVYLRVVTDAEGQTRALNHFNKKAKGELVRALALSGAAPNSAAELRAWAGEHGVILREDPTAGVCQLVISE